MKSFNTLYTDFTDISGNSSAANLVKGKQWINDSQKTVCATYQRKWPFLEKTWDLVSVDGTAEYQLNIDCEKITHVEMQQSSSVKHHPTVIEDPAFWDYLRELNASESDVTQYVYQTGPRTVSLWPTPATSALTIRVRGRKKVKDMTAADYTTGTILTWANGDDDITGTTTVWTSAMTGRFIRVTSDGMWYEILSRSANTAIKTVKNFEGTSIAAGSEAYTIGEMSVLPEGHEDVILWRALAIYYDQNNNPEKSDRYWKRYDGGYEAGLSSNIGGALKAMWDAQQQKSDEVFLPPDLEEKRTNQNNPPQDIAGESW